MATRFTDITGGRKWAVDARVEHLPDSVFFMEEGTNTCIEFSRSVLVAAYREEMGLFEGVDEGLRRFFAVA